MKRQRTLVGLLALAFCAVAIGLSIAGDQPADKQPTDREPAAAKQQVSEPQKEVIVESPFAAVEANGDRVQVLAPFTDVRIEKRKGWLRVLAPFVSVERDKRRGLRVIAPFVHVRVKPAAGAKQAKPQKSPANSRQQGTKKPDKQRTVPGPVPSAPPTPPKLTGHRVAEI